MYLFFVMVRRAPRFTRCSSSRASVGCTRQVSGSSGGQRDAALRALLSQSAAEDGLPGHNVWRLRRAAAAAAAAAAKQQHISGAAPSAAAPTSRWLYQPHISSYDYCAPIAESGGPGCASSSSSSSGSGNGGSDSGAAAVRSVLAAAAGLSEGELPPLPPPPAAAAYAPVALQEGLYVLDALQQLSASCASSGCWFAAPSLSDAAAAAPGRAAVSVTRAPQPLERVAYTHLTLAKKRAE